MKVVAILGGLGSQMVKYAFYLDVKKKCKDEKCYIDTTAFHSLKMWNGYELERIFGIRDEDFYDLYTKEEQETVKSIPYRIAVMDKMKVLEPERDVYCTNRGKVIKYGTEMSFPVRLRNKVTELANKYWYGKVFHDDRHIDRYPDNYLRLKGNTFYDEFNHTSDEYFRDSREEVLKVFKFPEFADEQNTKIADQMLQEESVALHVRRSDHMYDNEELFTGGFFQKSVDKIRSRTRQPIFYIFSDEPEWCGTHLSELGLDDNDRIICVDWNCGKESFRDMQLMTYCKHNIMVISSFSWWGYYLSKNTEGKIACAPKGYWFDVENHF